MEKAEFKTSYANKQGENNVSEEIISFTSNEKVAVTLAKEKDVEVY